MKRKLVNIIKLAIIIYVSSYFIYLINHNLFSPIFSGANTSVDKAVPLLTVLKETKYITCTVYEAGGLGNQIWRFASLYGMAKLTGRMPYFEINQFQTTFTKTKLKLTNLSEIAHIFPLMHETLQIKDSPKSETKLIDFAEDCCKYEDPRILQNIPQKFLKISGNYLQAYKFFHSYRNEIQDLLECGPSILSDVHSYANNLFGDDKSFKLCAHIRREDFLNDPLLESRTEFIIPAIKYAHKHPSKLGLNNISLIFMGDDKPFMKSLIIENLNFHKIYIPELKTRGEDMCFGIHYCESLIMTSSGSTFAWWISYLMKSKGPVFRNSQISKSGKESKDIHDFHLFLPEWISLSLKSNGEIVRETQWWHEKIGLNLSAPKMFISQK